MTIISVYAPRNRLSVPQRRQLAMTLTDAVLVPEIGQLAPPARVGFQVHFRELALDEMAIGGVLLCDQDPVPDVMVLDIAVMDGDWRDEVRRQVIERTLRAMADACGLEKPAPAWWANFRVIDEGSWGSRGGVLSILDLLRSGVFTADRVGEIRAAQEKIAAGKTVRGPMMQADLLTNPASRPTRA